METPVQAELLSVGTELLRGEIIDTNASYIAAQLPLLGIELSRITTAGDNLFHLKEILNQALSRCTLIIASGGLGPTEDDLTREAIAGALGETLSIDSEQEKNLRSMFSRFGREMPPHNLKQAMLIPSARALSNPRGTAPGWWVEKDGKVIISLPGPPREMMPMWQNEVVPRLKARFLTKPILARTIKTFFIAEAKVAELVQPFFELDNPTLGIYAKPDGIQVRLIATGDNATSLLDNAEHKINNLLSPYVWGRENDTLEGLVTDCLKNNRLSLATIEDVTGGLVGNIITGVSGNISFYRGGAIVPTDEAKIAWGVNRELMDHHGAVSSPVAEALAAAARDRMAADIGVSITGITEPGGSSGLPQGTVFIGLADKSGIKTWQQQYQPGRADTRERAAIAVLFRLRERLIELKLMQ